MKLFYFVVFFNLNCFSMGDPNFVPANPVEKKPIVKDLPKNIDKPNQIESKQNRQAQEYIKNNRHKKNKDKIP